MVRAAPDELLRRGRSTAAISPQFDALVRRYGVRSARPLRGADRGLSSVDQRLAAEGARQRRTVRGAAPTPSFATTYVLEVDPSVDAEAAARELAMLAEVVYAEPDRERHVNALTNDPFLASSGSWGQAFGDLWGLHRIAAPAAWEVARGAGIVIAISDSGIDVEHPDLAANIWINPGEISGNGIDDDGNGYIDDVHGWNSVGDNADVFDDHGHGTHVAGSAAAGGNNGTGIVGVAYESRLMAVRGISATGTGFDSNLAEGILYAIDNGARVINASWGGGGSSQTLTNAIAAAHAAGVVFVAAAGNDSIDVVKSFPAGLPTAVAVAASTSDDVRAEFSNYGFGIDVAAPGGGDSGAASVEQPARSVLSTRSSGANAQMTGSGKLVVGGDYVRQAGTSMAAPHVSGAAAVVLSQRPELSVEQVRQALRHGADDVGAPGVDVDSGYGRLNVAGALAVVPLEARITTPQSGAQVGGTIVSLAGFAAGPGFVSYRIEYGNGVAPTAWTPLVGPIATPVSGGALADVDISALLDGAYTFRLLVEHASGALFEDRSSILVNRIFLTAPGAGAMFGDGAPIEVRGTIAPADFVGFSVRYRVEAPPSEPWSFGTFGDWTDAGITLAGGGAAPVVDGVIATFEPSVLAHAGRLRFEVSIERGSGPTTRSAGAIVDPSLKAGWPRSLVPPSATGRNILGATTNAPTLVDVDRDGSLEIVLAAGDYLYVMRADGSDMPGWPALIERDPNEVFVIWAYSGPSVADLDGDGDLELVASRSDRLHVFDHQGHYVAGWPRTFRGLSGAGTALADLDGDGDAEIVFRTAATYPHHPDSGLHAVRVDGTELPGFPTDPAAAYKQGCCWAGRVAGYDEALSIGDIDGDGSNDIAAAWTAPAGPEFGSTMMRLFVVDAQGQLKRHFPRSIGRKPFPHRRGTGPVLADLDADGVLDIAIGRHDRLQKIDVMRGNGRRLRADYELGRDRRSDRRRNAYDPLVAADVTGDGRPEIFVPTNLDAKPWPAGDAPPRLEDQLLIANTDGPPMPNWPLRFAFLGSQKVHGAGSPSLGDIDGDGRVDVVVGTGVCAGWDVSADLCWGLWAFGPDGVVLPGFPKPTRAPNATALTSPALGDLDGDGTMEIVMVDAITNVMVYEVPGPPGPRQLPWPMSRQNPAHTNALPVVP